MVPASGKLIFRGKGWVGDGQGRSSEEPEGLCKQFIGKHCADFEFR